MRWSGGDSGAVSGTFHWITLGPKFFRNLSQAGWPSARLWHTGPARGVCFLFGVSRTGTVLTERFPSVWAVVEPLGDS